MTSIYDIHAQELVAQTAQALKKVEQIKAPEWAAFVKTGHQKEKSPEDKDWWYMRTASILYKIARRGPVGVEKLRTTYGGKKNRGVAPEKFFKASGNIIRKAFQQLEAAGLIKKEEKAVHRGRVLTKEGKAFLVAQADAVLGAQPNAKPAEKPAEAKAEAPKEQAPVQAE